MSDLRSFNSVIFCLYVICPLKMSHLNDRQPQILLNEHSQIEHVVYNFQSSLSKINISSSSKLLISVIRLNFQLWHRVISEVLDNDSIAQNDTKQLHPEIDI